MTICLQIVAMIASAVVSFAVVMLLMGLLGITSPLWQGEVMISLVLGSIVLAICSVILYVVVVRVYKNRRSPPSVWNFCAAGGIQGAIFHPLQIVTAAAVTERAFWLSLAPDMQVWMGLAISGLLGGAVALFVIVMSTRVSSSGSINS